MRLIDADKIADYVCDKCGAVNCDRNPTYCVERDFIVDCAKEMPEAVVRCKDCRYFAGEGMYCENNIIPMFDHFYCYYGERREDE